MHFLKKVFQSRKAAFLLAVILIISLFPTAALAVEDPSYTAYVTYRLNVRTGPSAGYSVVGILAEGTPVTVYAQEGSWCQIDSGAISGWCSANFLSRSTETIISGDSQEVPEPTIVPAPSVSTLADMKGQCTATALNVRSAPSTNSARVGTIYNQNYVDVLSVTEDGQWYQISTGSLTGYVNAAYLTLVNKADIVSYTQDMLTGDSQYLIMIIKSKQIGVIFEKDAEGNYSQIVRQFLVSSGKYAGYTPTGTYQISDQYTWRLMKGDVYAQYASRFAPNLLLHSVPYAQMKASTLNTYQYNQLGKPASSGCVRMRVEDCKWIFDNCEPGTVVKVVDDAQIEGLDENITYEWLPEGVTWDPTDPNPDNPYYGQYD